MTDSHVQLAGLRARHDALRQAAAMPGADLRLIADSALAELDAAIEAAAGAGGEGHAPSGGTSGEQHAERRLLLALFQDAPVPLFVLEREGIVRRVNRSAGALLGSGTGYATGKPFTTFVDLRSRAAVHSQLAAVNRTGKPRAVRCELLTAQGTQVFDLAISLARPRSDFTCLIVALSRPDAARPPELTPQAAGAAAAPGAARPVVAAMTRRLDLVTAVTRLLLDHAASNEAVTLRRCARLLADELVSWAIVDIAQDHRLRRQFVLGPEAEDAAELARAAAAFDPMPGSAPSTAYATCSSQLIAHSHDAEALGPGPLGLPLLIALGATSVLSVPLAEGGRTYGALTLARRAGAPPFAIADLALVEELGQQLALAIKMDREVRRHAEIADALRESLLLRELPEVPGAQVAINHAAATQSPEVGGDFCDIFGGSGGWRLAIGDVCGRGSGVAAMSAAARHAIRVVGQSVFDPAAVLGKVNQFLLAEEYGGRFVTACLARADWHGGRLRITLASAGHPPPVVLRADGRTARARGGGVPLGIFPDVEVEVETLTLCRGDTLVCFTDGLTDAHSHPAGYFGDRLAGEIAALSRRPAAEILSGLHDRVLAFCRGDIRDDVTLIAIQADAPSVPSPR